MCPPARCHTDDVVDDHYQNPPDPGAQLAPYLRPGERLLWAGRPDPQVRFAPVDAFLVPFSIRWGGFAVFWEVGVVTSGAPPFFMLWGIPFVLAGLYFIIGRFVYKKRKKMRTAYGITAGRVIVAVGETNVTDLPVKNVPVSIRRSRDGRHVSITFGTSSGWRWGGYYANTGMHFFNFGDGSVGFFDVAKPEAVLAALDVVRSN